MAGPSKKSSGKAAAKHTSKKAAGTKRAATRSGVKAAAKPRPATRSVPATKSGAATRSRAEKKAAAAPTPSPERVIPESTRQMVSTAAAACEEKKAEDIRILELDAVDAGFTDFFLIASGTNERQTQTIADEVELRMKREFGTYPNSVEGKRQGEWILLDYVDFVVHIFLAEKRAFYDIERLRKSARHVDAVELQNALKKKTASTRKRVATNTAAASHAIL